MPEAVSPMTAWHDFYLIVGPAAAALTGLMFVAMPLVPGTRLARPSAGIGAFSTPTVVHLVAPLLVATLLIAPWRALWQLGVVLGLAGLAGLAYGVVVVRRARRLERYQLVLDEWLCYAALPLAASTALVIAALVLPRQPVPALFGIGAVTLLLLAIGIHNAWDIVTYIAVEHMRPEE